jgi:hypothetical protein
MSSDELNNLVEDTDSIAAELFEAISHPIRIQILRILNGETTGFSELKHRLGISSSGNLSHHLGKLRHLICNNSKGKYEITDQGREALFALQRIRVPTENNLIFTHIWTVGILWYAIWLSVSLFLMTHDLRLTFLIQIPAVLSASIFTFTFRKLTLKGLQKEN